MKPKFIFLHYPLIVMSFLSALILFPIALIYALISLVRNEITLRYFFTNCFIHYFKDIVKGRI